MNLKDISILLIFILLPLLAGFLGSFFTAASIPTWYNSLEKPAFNPPSWIFGPVWTFLYITMGIAAFLILKSNHPESKFALGIFWIQLVLNAAWTPLFFGLHLLLLAFFEIVLLWIFILWTIIKFIKISTAAGLLLIPYILWVSFASILNFTLWNLNK